MHFVWCAQGQFFLGVVPGLTARPRILRGFSHDLRWLEAVMVQVQSLSKEVHSVADKLNKVGRLDNPTCGILFCVLASF